MKPFIVELSDGDFTNLIEDFNVVIIPNSNTAFVYCNNEDLIQIKKLPNFVNVTPDNPSAISDFKSGLY